jgi:hypothetical protein
MRIPTAAVLLVATVFVAGSAQAQGSGSADQRGDAFRRCTNDMALWTLRRKAGQIDKNVVDEILSDCVLQAPDHALLAPQRDRDAWMAQARREVAAQIAKLALRAKAEKADEDQAGANYFLCLERHAKVLALASDFEAADIIAQASLSACPVERAAVFEIHRRHDGIFDEATMKATDSVLVQRLLLEIVEIRAQRNLTPVPAPEPKPRKTPI